MNHHVHIGQQAAENGKRQYPSAHRRKTIDPPPVYTYMGEQHATHSIGGCVDETREEGAENGNKPCVIVECVLE